MEYAASARAVLFVWGSRVLYSLDHGHNFHPLPLGVLTAAVDFASTPQGEFAVLCADGTVALGGIDSRPRVHLLIPPRAPPVGVLPSSLLFSHEGTLDALSVQCEPAAEGLAPQEPSCAPQRSAIARTDEAWDDHTADFELAGLQCAADADAIWESFRAATPMTGSRAQEQSAPHDNIGPPHRIFFDANEAYSFTLKAPASVQGEWRPLTFQLDSAAQVLRLGVESTAPPPRRQRETRFSQHLDKQ